MTCGPELLAAEAPAVAVEIWPPESNVTEPDWASLVAWLGPYVAVLNASWEPRWEAPIDHPCVLFEAVEEGTWTFFLAGPFAPYEPDFECRWEVFDPVGVTASEHAYYGFIPVYTCYFTAEASVPDCGHLLEEGTPALMVHLTDNRSGGSGSAYAGGTVAAFLDGEERSAEETDGSGCIRAEGPPGLYSFRYVDDPDDPCTGSGSFDYDWNGFRDVQLDVVVEGSC